jgi:signal peptidase I
MENTLLIGDHVFVDRILLAPATKWMGKLLPYRAPRHGDVFVFLHPTQPGLYVVKRVMGLPGDHIHLQDGVVYRNGERLNVPYVIRCTQNSGNASMCIPYDSYRDNFPTGPTSETPCEGCEEWRLALPSFVKNGDIVVPPKSILAMGDNRDVSLDSRYWGFIPKENVIGRPMFVYWSFNTPPDQYRHTDFSERIGFLVHVIVHFFDETRWRRTFRIVQ